MNGSRQPLSCIDLNPLQQGPDLHTDLSPRTSGEAGTHSRGNLQATVSAILCLRLVEWKASVPVPMFASHVGKPPIKTPAKTMSLHFMCVQARPQMTLLTLHPAVTRQDRE